MRPDDVGLGGFDSHTLPPACRAAACIALAWTALAWTALAWTALAWTALAGTALCASPAAAQQKDSARVGIATADTTPRPKRVLRPVEGPPISPARAFIYSAALPGLGQAALERKNTGTAFFLVETLSMAFLHRAAEDLRIARAFVGDSVPLRYVVDPTTGLTRRDGSGNPVVAEWQVTRNTKDLIRARQLHYEDWVAILIFNHLFAGADAFVAAQLWDLPAHVSLRASPLVRGGLGISASLSFR